MNEQQGKLITSFEPNGGKTVWLMTQQPHVGVAVYCEKSTVTVGTVSHIQKISEYGEIFEGTVHLSCTNEKKQIENVKYTFKVNPIEHATSITSILL